MPSTDLEASLLSGQGISAGADGRSSRAHPEDRGSIPGDRSDDEGDEQQGEAELNTDDELGSDLDEPTSSAPRTSASTSNAGYTVQQGLDGRGATRGAGFQRDASSASTRRHQTGIKGVLGDAAAADAHEQAMLREARLATRERLASRAMVAMTLDEEDKVKRAEERKQGGGDDELERWRRRRREEMRQQGSTTASGGGGSKLREVDARTFVEVLDRTRGCVVVLLSEPDLPRCEPIARRLEELDAHANRERYEGDLDARSTFLRARATELEFSLIPSSADGGGDEEDVSDLQGGRRSDPDVLPTILCYRGGQLVRSLVRVDLEDGVGADGRGLEALLRRSGVITETQGGSTSAAAANEADDNDFYD